MVRPPMFGLVQLLEREIGRVTDAVLALPFVDGRVALLWHSMASDIIVRRALEDPRIAATVGSGKTLVSAAFEREDRLSRGKEAVMEWVLKLEAKRGRGGVAPV